MASEAEKYEVLERIGAHASPGHPALHAGTEPLVADIDITGQGSFGIIHKVRRKTDGLVCCHWIFVIIDYTDVVVRSSAGKRYATKRCRIRRGTSSKPN